MSKFRGCLAALPVVFGLLAAQSTSAPAAMYWGATISGEPYGQTGSAPFNESAWDLFERHAGRKVAVLNTSQAWVAFDAPEMDATRARGAIPIVTMGLAEGVTLEQIAAGGQDSAIRSWARAAKTWAHPFFLAPWWEMNGAWYAWGRNPSFVAAWRHFHDLVVAEGATNVTWSWISNSLWSDPLSDPAPYYPGAAYVDWAGIDTYNWGRNPAQPDRWINPDQTITPNLSRIEEIAPGKPYMILENASSEYGGNKTDWIAEMLGTYLPHHPQIKAYLWFNWNFEKDNGKRADWPIESSAPAQQAFRKGIQSGIYRSTRPSMPDLTPVPPPPAPSGGEGPHSVDVSPSAEEAIAPQLAVAADGTATVVWSGQQAGGDFQVYGRRIAPDGTPGAIEQLSEPLQDALSPQVAVAPDGTATVVWIRSDGSYFVVQERRIAPDGTLEAVQDLSVTGRDAAEPQVAVAPDGTATAVWKRFDGSHFQIKERRIAPDGSLEEPSSHTLSDTSRDAVEPQVTVAPDGTATVLWTRFDSANTIVQESRVAPDGTPASGVDNLSAAGQNAVQPDLVVDPAGTATAVWVRSNGSDTIVQERRIPAGGPPEAAVNDLSAPGGDAAEPQIALAPDGTATVVWDRFDGSSFVVQDRRITPAGSLEATTRNLSTAGRDAAEPQVAIAPNGAGTVVWSRFEGSNFRVQRRGLAPGGSAASTIDNLSAAGHSAGDVQLAPGTQTAVWRRFDGANDIVQGSTVLVPAMPAALLAPAAIDFGSIELGSGESVEQVFELTNSGNAPLSVSSISVGGADADQFSLTGTDSCTGAPLAPGAICEFSAVFEPSTEGELAATVEIVSNAASSPDAASLSGTGVAAASPEEEPAAARVAAVRPKAIDNSFTVGRPVLNRKKGTARLPVTLPGAGTLISVGSGVTTVPVAGPETVTLQVRARGRKMRALKRSGKVALKLTLTFVPVGGTPNSRDATLRLRKAR